MAKVSVRVMLNGIDRRLRDAIDGDYTKAMRQSGQYMEGAIGRRFSAGAFKPLSPATIKIHPHRAGGKPLNDTGALRGSVTAGAFKQASSTQLRYGTNKIYAPIHNFGGTGGWGTHIPQREFLYFDGQDEQKIRRIFQDFINEELGRL
ncbi:hypothetical protein CN367_11710 [Priestia megaterium]|uniref:phage virion morphogenesis protein n=1 Tax=Priestia megaterium TaxID=1404 RepID=UPI000BF3B0A9|nr:phage virion morphogenesis protein [Priestia megaterium]PEZ47027.1 hypothetical protein CN367_11710 [Priestia megaterium]